LNDSKKYVAITSDFSKKSKQGAAAPAAEEENDRSELKKSFLRKGA